MPDLREIEFRLDAVERTLKDLSRHIREGSGTTEIENLRDKVKALKHAIASGGLRPHPSRT